MLGPEDSLPHSGAQNRCKRTFKAISGLNTYCHAKARDGTGAHSGLTGVVASPAGTLPLVPWYSCDPATCLPANNCQCASQQAPLPADQMPQFILYTVRLGA